MEENPLLSFTDLPPFEQIRPEHVEPAVDTVLDESRAALARLVTDHAAPTWASLARPLEALDDRLARIWSPVSHLNGVRNSEPLRKAYNACLPKLADWSTEVGQNRALCDAWKRLAEGPEGARLDAAQRKVVENVLRDFHLAGVDLPDDKKARYKAIQQELSTLTSQFSEHVLDATMGWTRHVTDAAQLAGLPETAQALARQSAEAKGLEGWLFTLEFPSYYAVMTHADDRELRRELYTAYATRASDQGPNAGQWDNSAVMETILALRHELAELLGYRDYSELSLATKMAPSPQQVLDFLNDLAERSLPMARREYRELADFACESLGLETLEPWDVAYASEKQRRARFDLSQEDLRPWFPAPKVVDGLFAVVERLFGLSISEETGVETWHPDVRFFTLRDRDGALRGHFYLDLYAREHKRGGAWMDVCRGRRIDEAGAVQHPVAYLVCNFTPPVVGRPALLSHDEVLTLFHEFGHGLHHMLTQVDCAAVAGIEGVAWDAVELPSQFLENWCWEREALDLISGHHESGEPLPEALYQRMVAARNYQAGMQMVRQLEFSLFDFRIHRDYDPAQGGRIQAILDEVRDAVAVVRPPQWHRFQHAFSHIFAGGYAAGYYSYKWAEVLSADAYSRFEEEGLFSPQAGGDFMRLILEQGGSREPMALFTEFRGREPSIEPLLRHNGIIAEAAG